MDRISLGCECVIFYFLYITFEWYRFHVQYFAVSRSKNEKHINGVSNIRQNLDKLHTEDVPLTKNRVAIGNVKYHMEETPSNVRRQQQ